jgi:hypothetical protein
MPAPIMRAGRPERPDELVRPRVDVTGQVTDGLEQALHRRARLHRPVVRTDGGDCTGQRGHRVVRVAHRAVAGHSAGGQTHPRHALLPRLEQVKALPAHLGGEAADLADGLPHALEQLWVLVDEPVAAPSRP